MIKYPIFKQDDEISCGAYCIKMILNYYHYDDEIKNIKKRCRLTREGITVFGMLQCLKEYHIDAKAYQCQFKNLLDDVQLPAIIHIKNQDVYHYIVLYKVHNQYFLVGDPAKGLVKITYEEMSEKMTGVIIQIYHVGRPIEQISSFTFRYFIFQHFQKYYPSIVKMVIQTLLVSFLSVFFSFYYQMLIDRFQQESYFYILIISLAFLTVYIIKTCLTYYRNQNTIELKMILDHDYVIQTIKNMLYLDLESLQMIQQGSMITRAHHLFELSDYFIKLYHVLFIDLIMIVCIVITMYFIHFNLFFMMILFIIVILFLFVYSSKQVHMQNKIIMEKQEVVNQGMIEYHQNMFQTIQFKMKRTMKNKLHYLYDEFINCQFKKETLLNLYNMKIELIVQFMMMGVLLLAIFFYKKEKLTLGTVMMLYMLMSYLIEPIIDMASFVIVHDESQIIFEKYKEMLPDKIVKKKKIRKIKNIQIENMTFSYGYTKPLFEHFYFNIAHSLHLKGDTGSGKSTLLKLISGQLKAVKGKILINGYDINEIDKNCLYHKMKYLDKTPCFYQESLKFNLLLENKKNEQKMLQLLKYFMLDDLIEKLNINLDVNGGFLSSGQQQLIMIIRALLTDVQVLILDEAFSHVDDQRVKLLLAYLDTLPIIVIIVSHQINVMNNNYECVIIDSGKIINNGW